MELVIKTDLKNSFPELVEFNYPELKVWLKNSLEKYKGVVYDSTQIQEAKATRANLNKLRDAIDAERKAVKAICLKPFEDFEAKTKELMAMVSTQSKEIDNQVKKFEDGKKAEKKAELAAFYAEVGSEVSTLVPFDKIFDEKWLNSSVSMKAVQDVIKNTAARIVRELETIDGFGGKMALQCKDVYLKTLNLADALNEKTRLEQLQARIEAEEAKKTQAEQPGINAAKMQMHNPSYDLAFRVIGATAKQLAALSAFMADNNIKFERA